MLRSSWGTGEVLGDATDRQQEGETDRQMADVNDLGLLRKLAHGIAEKCC